jgi:hypothetical protein
MLGLFFFPHRPMIAGKLESGEKMAYRIELMFVGEAPAGELERARIMASADVTAAIDNLSKALEAAGLPHAVNCRTVRESMGRPRKTPPWPIPHAADAAE